MQIKSRATVPLNATKRDIARIPPAPTLGAAAPRSARTVLPHGPDRARHTASCVPAGALTQHLGERRASTDFPAGRRASGSPPLRARSRVSNSCDYGLLIDRRAWRENRKFLLGHFANHARSCAASVGLR